MELQTLDPKPLRVFSNDRDLLRDLFTYLDYISEHSIKRMTRTNEIPRANSVHIAKLLGDPELVKAAQETGGTQWIDFIDTLAWDLRLVSYDIKGEYRGYTSSEPSFIENFIVANSSNFDKFLALPPMAQEKRILDTLIHARSHSEYNSSGNNEFYQVSILGELDAFYPWGAATGIMPMLKFPEIRMFLLEVLKNCPAGQWFSTESLIAYLKANHPYFLIPQTAPQKDKWGNPINRYGNFYEGKERWVHNDKAIPDDARDGFERVEGRYVERFLEHIPLIMRFVDVAYDPQPYTGPLPSRGMLKAFRISERFLHLMSGEESTPKVTVQPNFDVVIEADFYPAKVIRQVAALGEQMSSPDGGHGAYVGVFQLKKIAVAAAQIKTPDLDVISLLKTLSGRDLPPNVQIELDEWAGHADQFTLYDGFALLETNDVPLEAEKFIVERITPALYLVRSPEKVYAMLETLGHVPIRVQHPVGQLARVAESAASLFPKESALVNVPQPAREVMVGRVVTIGYQFPDVESFDAIKKMLAELRCPFQSDPATRIVSIQQKEQGKFDEAVQKLAGEYVFEVDK